MRVYVAAFAVVLFSPGLYSQNVRPKDVREIAKDGSGAIPKLQELLSNPDKEVRREAVKQIVQIGTQKSLDPLIQATRDNDPEAQILAADGLVNFYYPGYVQFGLGGSLKRVGTSIKGVFTDTNDQAVDSYVVVRPEVVQALARQISGGGSMEARANAARAVGVLRGAAAVQDLVEATHAKDSDVIYESLIALQKIREESAGPRVEFRLHDLDSKVQIAAIATVGLLRDKGALPDLTDVLKRARDVKVKRAALTSIAMLPDPASRPLYEQYLHDKDENLRGAAAEGFARLRDPNELAMLEQAWQDEGKTSPRLSLAFAQVMLGRKDVSEFSPLRFLIDNLNSAAYNGDALPFLVELARDEGVRTALYGPLSTGTKDEKIGLARVLARSGDAESVAPLQKLSGDSDAAVAQEGLRALRTLQARM
ncbi:MAG: HEAT repeat domain-containing protein [Bryobacteraceae bacterium]|jgi:HEAT repeat protein